jgi:hypothetical protein
LLLALRPSDSAINVNDNLFWLVGQRGDAFVAHLGELLDGALLDFWVLVVEEFLPYLE